MDPAWAAEIIDVAKRLWSPAEDLEITLEANPTDAEARAFRDFALAGVGRLSLGVQSLDDGALGFLGRNHDAATARRAAEAAGAAFPRLSLDLIYALPGQTAEDWARELREAVDLGAEHISPYQLTIEAGTAFERAVRRGRWRPPDADLAAALFETTQTVLGEAGFDAYEVSNHARGEAARSRHNLVYWRGWDYAGAGPGAHGRITTAAGREATFAAPKASDYIRQVAETGVGFQSRTPLSAREAAEERVLAGLRIAEGVARSEVAALDISPDRIADLVELGLLADDPARLRATPAGRLVLDRLTAALAA
jgi:oxygen-independent coproporphyrinogen-3 oxidase